MSKVRYRTFILSTLISTLFWAMFYLDLGAKLGHKVTLLFKTASRLYLYGIIIMFLILLYFTVRIKISRKTEKRKERE